MWMRAKQMWETLTKSMASKRGQPNTKTSAGTVRERDALGGRVVPGTALRHTYRISTRKGGGSSQLYAETPKTKFAASQFRGSTILHSCALCNPSIAAEMHRVWQPYGSTLERESGHGTTMLRAIDCSRFVEACRRWVCSQILDYSGSKEGY